MTVVFYLETVEAKTKQRKFSTTKKKKFFFQLRIVYQQNIFHELNENQGTQAFSDEIKQREFVKEM